MTARFVLAKPTIVYIDGFNFYYGAVKHTPYRWLDLQAFCTRLLKDDDVRAVRYFTSLVSGARGARQAAFLGALSTLPLVKTVLGKFKEREVTCSHQHCTFAGDRVFRTPEEKRTDVGIAVAMLDDAYQNRCEKLVLISGDSDLVPVVALIRQQFPGKRMIVYTPTPSGTPKGRRADELRVAAGGDGRILPTTLFASCQLPDPVVDARGNSYAKPARW